MSDHYAGSCPPGQHCCLCAEDALKQQLAAANAELERLRGEIVRLEEWERRAVASMDEACKCLGAACCDLIPIAVKEKDAELERLRTELLEVSGLSEFRAQEIERLRALIPAAHEALQAVDRVAHSGGFSPDLDWAQLIQIRDNLRNAIQAARAAGGGE